MTETYYDPADLARFSEMAEGSPADLTVLSPDTDVAIRASALVSKSKNTPFDGWTLKGAVAATIVGGRVVFVNQQLPEVRRALEPM